QAHLALELANDARMVFAIEFRDAALRTENRLRQTIQRRFENRFKSQIAMNESATANILTQFAIRGLNVVGGNEHDRYAAEPLIVAHFEAQLESIKIWHQHIADNEIGRLALRLRQG